MKNDRWTNFLIFILIVLVGILVFLQISQYIGIDVKIKSAVESVNLKNGKDGYTPIKGIDYIDGKDGITPIKGKDYFDGKDGSDGIGQKGDPGEKGKDGSNGLTPELRCNTQKNRWEVKYESSESWRVLGEEPVRCTIDS